MLKISGKDICNAVRHGRPTEVLLRVGISEDSIEIQIQDNGCGFELGKTKGHGLENLHQRMNKLKGTCTIQSLPDSGTTVILKLPFPNEPEQNGSRDN
jgi:signal transduction histidine kinase